MRVSELLGHQWTRTGAGVMASVLVVGSIAVFGADKGFPAQDVKLLSGMAWLSSAKVGQVTLLDGSSAEVAAQVQVAPAGNDVQVVQSGSTAYAVDKTTGTIRRVDGATFEMTPPEAPIPGAHNGLTAFAGPDVLYALDSARGVLVDTDPRTAARRGDPQTLATQLGDGTSTLDDAGRLWLVDNTTGDLTWIADGKRNKTLKLTSPSRNIITVANGVPVVVDTVEGKVITIDPSSGTADQKLDLDLRSDDTIQVSGSPHTQRAYVVASRGVVNICDLAAGSCERAIPLAANSKLGAAVEAGNRLFVPDYGSGQVWIIDLNSGNVVAKPQVIKTAKPFQLLSRDGVVFFNDQDSEQAGVIQLDGAILSTAKYNPLDPRQGLTTQVNSPSPPNQPPATNQPEPPSTAQPQQPEQTRQPDQPQQTNQPQQPTTTPPQTTQPTQTTPNPPGPTTTPSTPSTPPSPDPSPLPVLTISANPAAAIAGDPAGYGVTASDRQQLSEIVWSFQGGGGGTGSPVSHTFAAAGSYLVTVQAKIPDGRPVTGSTRVTVGRAPTIKVTVAVTGGGRVTGGPFGTCTATCTRDVDRRHNITLTATPNAGQVFLQWRNVFECGAPGDTTCELRMAEHSADLTVGAEFEPKPVPTTLTVVVKWSVLSEGSVSVRGGATGTPCAIDGRQPSRTCTYTVPNPQHEAVFVSATPKPGTGSRFFGWTAGPCKSATPNCTFNVFQDTTIEGTFTEDSPGFVWILPLVGLGMPPLLRRQRRRRQGI